MTTTTGMVPWALRDSWTLTLRALRQRRRQPWAVVITLMFPVLMVLMFGYLLGGAIAVPDGDYLDFLMPGLFALTMVFGLESTMTAVQQDLRAGITDRFRTLPMSSASVLLGRATADMLDSAAGLGVMLLTGLAVGWRATGTVGETLAAVGLLLLLRFALLWAGILLGLVFPGSGSLMAVQILVWPFAFLSNAFVPAETMPAWLATLAEWNPVAATVTATRDLFGNPGADPGSWVGEHAMLLAVVWPVLLTLVLGGLAVRRWRTLDR